MSNDKSEASMPGYVPSVARAVDVLRAIGEAEEAQSLARLTKRLGVPKSSLLGICNTLVSGGLLERNSAGGFKLGVRILDLAQSFLSHSNLTASFASTWDSRPRQEAIALTILDRTDVVYVASRYGAQEMSFRYKIGMRRPANCTASGKALLSTLPEDDLERLYANSVLSRLTSKSLATLQSLKDDLEATRKRGYSIDEEEAADGICCVGCPIFTNEQSCAVGAICTSMLAKNFGRHDHILSSLIAFAEDVSRRLGGDFHSWRRLTYES